MKKMNTLQKLIVFFKCNSWLEWMLTVVMVMCCAITVLGIVKYPMAEWFQLIILPAFISGIMGVVVSAWFTIKTEKEKEKFELEVELDHLHEQLLFSLVKATEIVSNPLIENEEKVRQLHGYFMKQADTYRIEEANDELFQKYYKIMKLDLEFISSLETGMTKAKFIDQFNLKFDVCAKRHHALAEEVLDYRQIVFQERRMKHWANKNGRIIIK